jgi:hypothetical protein
MTTMHEQGAALAARRVCLCAKSTSASLRRLRGIPGISSRTLRRPGDTRPPDPSSQRGGDRRRRSPHLFLAIQTTMVLLGACDGGPEEPAVDTTAPNEVSAIVAERRPRSDDVSSLDRQEPDYGRDEGPGSKREDGRQRAGPEPLSHPQRVGADPAIGRISESN